MWVSLFVLLPAVGITESEHGDWGSVNGDPDSGTDIINGRRNGIGVSRHKVVAFAQLEPHCDGKQVIVHLFEWKWTDIAKECERFLSKKGFCGVQVSPPMEHVMVMKEYPRPWWERYQPVSYKLTSRSGNEAEFKNMVHRCKAVGVRIYVDAVVNHMAGLGRSGTGTAGSHFNSDNRDFPGVPFSRPDFNDASKCPSHDGNVNDYSNPSNVRNCYLVGLTDLDQSKDYVREKIAGYFNHLVDIGVAGFRVDAAKHMWPGDIKAIIEKTKDVPGGGKPFFYHEVIDQNDGAIKVNEYYSVGRVTEFRYCQKIAWGIRNFGQLGGVVDYGWGMTDNAHAFVFVDNHDNQRGHGGGGNLITHKQPRDYKMATAFLLANDYGFTRVMSSYSFTDSSAGPPHNSDYSTKDVPINGDESCGDGWVCEHRWSPIANMVAFRNAVVGTTKQHYHNENDEVAFSRGNKGFFAMAKRGHMDRTLMTGLPAGTYCDIIHDCQQKITVGGDGMAHIVINNKDEPILAFFVGGDTSSHHNVVTSEPVHTLPHNTDVTHPGTGTTISTPTGYQRTVIFIHAVTQPGQDLFIRGGLDNTRHPGCTSTVSNSECAIPIRHRNGQGSHYAKANAWSKGDNYLDWHGSEPGQGSFNGQQATGTPAVWTTNQQKAGHVALNTFGDHYWMVDVNMDCSKTDNGWFELKAVINGRWEGDIHQGSCSGSIGGKAPFHSKNHIARCGVMNIYRFGESPCEIESLN